MPNQTNAALPNFTAQEINHLPSDNEKLKHIINYLEAVNGQLRQSDEIIRSLLVANENILARLNSHSDHINSHDQHLASHDEHLAILTKK